MSVLGFDEANSIYVCCEGTKVKVHSVLSPNLQIINKYISQLLRELSEDGYDEFWSTIVRGIKRFRFDLSAAPLSSEIIGEKGEKLYTFLKSKVHDCEVMYSSKQANMLNQLADLLQEFSKTLETSLVDSLSKLVAEEKMEDGAIVICEARLVPEVEKSLLSVNNLRVFEVVTPANLKESKCYSRVIIFGSPRWFPEFVFSSPRSKEIHVVKHKWIPGGWEPESVLVAPYKSHGSKVHRLIIEDESINQVDIVLEDLIPRIDIKKIQGYATEQLYSVVSDYYEVVNAKLFILENEWAVFLEADDDASVDIIDLDEEAKKRVRRAEIGELQPGMFLLLRTEGGGDYIVPVADRIMGKYKDKARAEQKKWKTLLRDLVKTEGAPAVIQELIRLGSTKARALNLMHWMSFRGIKTASFDDFLAIMKLINLEKEAEKYWDTMKQIQVAHTKAGFTIRTMMLELINKGDLDKLKRYGRMDFELADQGAGRLSAFRIKEISREATEVIHWKIGEPFRINDG